MDTTQTGAAQTEPQVIRCYIYAHVARSNPLAIERQIRDARALAESLSSPAAEYKVVRVFQDDGGSGLSTRPAYEEMLAGLDCGEADTVLVFAEDRLYRSLELQKAYTEMSARLGVTTYSVQSGRLVR
ncbi:recombinase family protein [Streptomyces sp. CC228A]|uniref:recombinase family protein n=1 Tax=Streptomyces sp. CC228A TaxID=2898186 RepID=UPI001F1DE8A7|nr:recombinase family protein [Streptomyces sp. CC228A]